MSAELIDVININSRLGPPGVSASVDSPIILYFPGTRENSRRNPSAAGLNWETPADERRVTVRARTLEFRLSEPTSQREKLGGLSLPFFQA